MKKTIGFIAFAAILGGVIGCTSEPAPAEDINAKLKAQPAEQQFQNIKNEQYLSPVQKEVAIDNLPVSAEQKAKWKEEIRSMGSTAPSGPSGVPSGKAEGGQ